MSDIFVKPDEEVKPIESDVIASPPKKVKKPKKQHISDERKEELKEIRVAALKKGREAKKAKREAEELAKAQAQETKTEEAEPLLPISESTDDKPKKQKAEKKPRAYKSINNSELELLKKEKRIKELEYENETNLIKQEVISWKNENRLLKERLDKMEEEKPVLVQEKKVVFREKKIEEKQKPKIVLPEKEKKKFVTRKGFKY